MELILKSAVEIVRLLRGGEISSADCLDALEAQIARVDSEINALPTLCFERARETVRQDPKPLARLGGIPVAIKDLTDVAGVTTTYGCSLYRDHIPAQSNFLVENLEANGAVIYAKSNTPEFGSGGNSFNDVFGATRNPYDRSRSAGGSSGGAAAALASGSAWLAQGSDLAGSLRTPASFCGVTSLRPSPGLIATSPGVQPFQVYAQAGPMARELGDLALFADAMTGINPRAGLAKSKLPGEFQRAASEALIPARVASSLDLGICETSAEVSSVFNAALARLGKETIDIESAHPDLSMADAAFDIPRALDYAQAFGADLDHLRDHIKPENIWNIKTGLELEGAEIRASMDAQRQIFTNASAFMQDYDLLLCPASITTPFPVEERYPGFSDGLAYSEYYRWLKIVYAITATTLPVITLPCGKTSDGLPVGMQLIGKPHREVELFSYAAYFEKVFAWDPLQVIRQG